MLRELKKNKIKLKGQHIFSIQNFILKSCSNMNKPQTVKT